MKDMPLDQSAMHLVFVAAVPHTREGVPVTNREGKALTNVSCLIPPDEAGGKIDTVEVRVPSESVPKQLQPFSPVEFDRLIARAWAVDGRSGVSFSADGVRQGGAAVKGGS